MLSSLHPISLLTRTDAELTTLFHSFYLLEYLKEIRDIRVVQRFPQDKPQIDTVEDGLKLFIINGVEHSTSIETTGKFVYTSSDSSRYFAFFRRYDTKIFVAVSCLPTMSFSRTLFELLEFENTDTIPPTLLTLCEIPVFPAPGLQYDVGLSKGTASLKFSAVEQVEDCDIEFIVLSIMTPTMLVKAWEAIVLERKVVVVSATDSIILACCEFLRRIVSPLVIVNTYVPLLPLQLIDTVDAPVPYLLGANTNMLKENISDLSDTVVVDLDTRTVVPRINNANQPDIFASANMISKLTEEVSDVMLLPLGDWVHRPANSSASSVLSPFSEQSYAARATRVLHVFKQTNLELMSARYCTVRAFWRRPAESATLLATGNGKSSHSSQFRKSGNTMMGFNYQDGVCCGFMQLAKELHDENDLVSHFTPCWVEMDQVVLSVYQHADDLPILYILLKDIEAVSPCAIEPEGHVFEMVVKDHMSYRFTVTDTESRQKWISAIDHRKTMDFSGFNDDQAFLDENFSNKVRITELEMTNVDSSHSIVGSPSTLGSASCCPPNSTSTGPTVCVWNGYELLTRPRDSVETNTNAASTASITTATGLQTGDDAPGSSQGGVKLGSPLTLGHPQTCPPIYADAAAVLAKEDTLFRFEFSRTQTMNYIHQKVECMDFQTIFRELKISPEVLLGPTYTLDANLNVVLVPSLESQVETEPHMSRTISEGAPGSPREAEVTMLQRTNTISGTQAASGNSCTMADTARRTSTRLSSKMFGGFFHKKQPSAEDDIASSARTELEREQEAEARRLKLIREKRKAALQSQIFVVTATYRRTQSELNALIVETRQAALQGLTLEHNSDCPRSPFATVSYPMKTLLANLQHTAPASKSPKPSPRTTAAVSPRSTASSSVWMDHIWLGLTNKTYEDYRRDNPAPEASAHGEGEGDQELHLSNTEIDEFIFDAQRTKTEAIERRKIKELILTYLNRQHDLYEQCKEYAPYMVIRHVLMGYLHESLGQSGSALEFYARGVLIEQRRLMFCLVQQFLAHIGKLQLIKAQSEPSSPSLAGMSVPNPMAALSHILASYQQTGQSKVPPVNQFLDATNAISPLVGLQAYRLVLELIYRDLVGQLDAIADQKEAHAQLNKELELGSFRTFPGSHRNVGKAHQTSARSRIKSSTLLSTDFEFTVGDPKSEAINSAVTCIAINVERSPCDLSALLLTELKEILKIYCQSPAGAKNSKKSSHAFSKLKLNASTIEDLSATSAFKAFEQHCCILQKVEPENMSVNERLLFWVNLFNTITVHAIIANRSPGSTLLERSAFLRGAKYNVGGVMHSLLDIEHGILRHSSGKPMLFGPLSVNLSFAERDPRRKQVLEEARPNISFVLCNACITSPALVVLKDPDTVNDEIKYYSRRYLHEHVKLDPNARTITLPGLMRVYWADFGGNRAKALRIVAQIAGSQFAAEMKPYQSPLEGLKAKVEFAKIDWTPLLSISD